MFNTFHEWVDESYCHLVDLADVAADAEEARAEGLALADYARDGLQDALDAEHAARDELWAREDDEDARDRHRDALDAVRAARDELQACEEACKDGLARAEETRGAARAARTRLRAVEDERASLRTPQKRRATGPPASATPQGQRARIRDVLKRRATDPPASAPPRLWRRRVDFSGAGEGGGGPR